MSKVLIFVVTLLAAYPALTAAQEPPAANEAPLVSVESPSLPQAEPPKVDSPADGNPPAPSNTQPPAVPENQPPQPRVKKPLSNLGTMQGIRIPGQPWRIHDATRPRPPVVVPGEESHQPPTDAVILFDGTDLSQWCQRGTEGELYEPMWNIVDGTLEVEPHSGNIYTIDGFGSCQLHIEWMIPDGVSGSSQGRGNSGIKLMERFEIQVLDSYRNRTYADGQAGAIYGQYPPLVNASRKPGEWQVYDIFFEAPKFEIEKLVRPASVTVVHNGVLVQLHRELPGATGAREPKYEPSPPQVPIMLQDHGNRIRYRNIWIREL